MKTFASIITLCFCLLVSGCKSDDPSQPKGSSKDSMSYQFSAMGLHDLRAGEYYVLWAKIDPDPAWQVVAPLYIRYRFPHDSVSITGKFFSDKPVESIKDALITVELTPNPLSLGIIIAHPNNFLFNSGSNEETTSFDSKQTLGNHSTLQGSLVFTSPLPDTTAYKHEFYLMKIQGAQHDPSLLSLQTLPAGWKYGLWASDSNFTPHQNFFYGLFQNPEGHDSDSSNDHYPFPGGWKIQSMEAPTGSIIVTLEPEIYGDSLKFKGPSAFTVLQFKRVRNIVKEKDYLMTNVTATGLPYGTITFRK